ncbi:MAG: ATP-binding cassette domain-containing protein, partial [candidate division Zixibacteria bacterium]|nr:ATP-binding cassette domain-containing protein [candidate division Zixibacteria bacterium]
RKESEASKIAMEYLSKVGLANKKESLPSELSGGQAQRVAIARALCMNPKIMLFDEPTSALDPVMTAEVLAVIRRLAEEGMTMIVISHEMNFARDVASKIAFMHDGKIIETDSPDKFLNSPRHEVVKGFIASYKSNGANGN